MKLPDFIIGGAPKCGTSSLYFWLAAHPEIFGSPVKETFFYSDSDRNFGPGPHCDKDGIEVYAKYFQHAEEGQHAFEATAHYIYCDNAREKLMNIPSQPKMIFLLREPSGQMYSHYRMIRYRLKKSTQTFAEYAANPRSRLMAEYTSHLSKWAREFGEDRMKIYLFEDLTANKREVLKDIAEFLGVDSSFYDHFDFEHRNKTVQIKSGKLHQLGLKLQRYIPHSVQKAIMPMYMKFNATGLPQKTEEEKALISELKREFAHEATDLKALFPYLPLHLWE